MIKLVALDLDGTLLNDRQGIDDKTVSALKMLRDKGIKIVLCSSRPFYMMEKYIEILDIKSSDQYTVSFNSGLIVENETKNIVFINKYTPMDIKEIIEIGKGSKVNTFLYEEKNVISNFDSPEYIEMRPEAFFEVRDFDNLDVNNLTIYKILFFGTIEKDISDLRKKIPKYIESKYNVTSSNKKNIEILPKNNEKAFGLQKLGEILGIKSNEMAVFGDNENDIDMFEYAGYGVAMGNAIDSIKEIASYITLSNNEDGIAHAIDKMIKEGLIK